MTSWAPRILFISSEFPPGPGGIGNHAYHVVNEFHKSGYEMIVIARQEFATEAEIAMFNQTQSFSIRSLDSHKHGASKAIHWMKEIIHTVKNWHPNLVVASGARAVWLAASASMIWKTPLLAIGHGSEFGGPKTFNQCITRWAFNRATSAVYVSHYTQGVARQLGIRTPHEHVIHNGADARLFAIVGGPTKMKLAQSLGFKHSDPILLTVGNLTQRKGQDVVIRALQYLLPDFPNLRYLMAGLPTDKKDLQALAHTLGVEEHIYFLSNVLSADLPDLYRACDLFVMTSQRLQDGDFEGFGISVIEAALCGKPAVVSGDSGLAEAVIDGVTGICVPEKDPVSTAGAIKRLLMNKEMLDAMGSKARERALKDLTWERVGASYTQVVHTILNKNEKPT